MSAITRFLNISGRSTTNRPGDDPMPNHTTITILDPQRRAEALAIFGTDTLTLISATPHQASAPGLANRLFYRADPRHFTPMQRSNLITHLSRKFRLLPDEVDRDLDDYGLPILAENVIVSTDDSHNTQSRQP